MRRQRGFSIVELMVSVVIGLLALMFATRMITGAERNKQAALGGSDAMQNGMLALFSISNDINGAGFGLNDPILVGCNTVMSDSKGYTLAPAQRGSATITPLAAAVIESNGTAPDRLSLYAANTPSGTATVRLVSDFTGGTMLAIDRFPYGFATDDVIVVAPESVGGNCNLAQVSSDPSAVTGSAPMLRFDAASNRRFNQNGLNGALYTGSRTRVFNLGPAERLPFHTWSVGDGFLRLRATDLAGAGNNDAVVADNIVSIKAQYGFDTRVGPLFDPEQGIVVSRWSPTMIDADLDGVAGSAGDYQRIAAVRVALVARSKSPERPAAGAVCDATPAALQVFTANAPSGVTAVPMTVNVAVTGDPIDWKCYRYRVFDTIVPIRNAAWRPSAWAK